MRGWVFWLDLLAIPAAAVGCRGADVAPAKHVEPATCRKLVVGEWATVSTEGFAEGLGEIQRPRAIWLADRLWLHTTALSSSKFYDPCTDRWSSAGLPTQADALESVEVSRFKNSLVLTGIDSRGTFSVWIYDGAWRSFERSGFAQRPYVLVADHRVILYAPSTADYSTKRWHSPWIFDLTTHRWQEMSDAPDLDSSYACHLIDGDTWFVYGGTDSRTLRRYSLSKNQWADVAAAELPHMARCKMVRTSIGIATIITDEDREVTLEFGVIDPSAGQYTKLPSPPVAGLGLLEGAVVAFGHSKADGSLIAVGFDATKKTWSPLPTFTFGKAACESSLRMNAGLLTFSNPTLKPDSRCSDPEWSYSDPPYYPTPDPRDLLGAWFVDGKWSSSTKIGTNQDLEVTRELVAATNRAWRRTDAHWETYDPTTHTWKASYAVAPKVTSVRAYGDDYVLFWGLPETRVSHDCRDPFDPEGWGEVKTCPPPNFYFTRFRSGGYILKR